MAKFHDPNHSSWARISHWIVAVSFFALVFSGFIILMCHPRFYWGEVGNDLTPALFELPVSRNYQHGGWDERIPFSEASPAAMSASRTYEIFNENGWGRSLHFLAAWFLVLSGLFYLTMGIISGHFRRNIFPHKDELRPQVFARDVVNHLRMRIPAASGGPDYGPLQKSAYAFIIFILFPMIAITGFAMSPAITQAYPFLSDMFGGSQSARTIHFFLSVALVLFLVGHVVMIIRSGFITQMRAMTFLKKKP